MTFRVVVRLDVDHDLLAAEAWYDRRRPGLGREFLVAACEAIDRISDNPYLFRLRHLKKGVRWALLKRFPYRVIFRVEDDIVVIYAIIHAARRARPRM